MRIGQDSIDHLLRHGYAVVPDFLTPNELSAARRNMLRYFPTPEEQRALVELWTREIQKDYGRFGLNWGYASSPLLYEDSLYVQVLHGMKTKDPSYLLRIDKKTGKTI